MTQSGQTVVCPTCASSTPLDSNRAGCSIICGDCKTTFLTPVVLSEPMTTAGPGGSRVVISPSGSWSHLGLPDTSSIKFEVSGEAEPPYPTEERMTEPPAKDWAVGIKVGDFAPSAPTASEPVESGNAPAEKTATEGDERLTAFADLSWHASEDATRATLEAKSYTLSSYRQVEGKPRQIFEGRMGAQPVHVTCSFNTDGHLEGVVVEISVEEMVQRDLYMAMRDSLDGKYGTERLEDHGQGPWSTTWLVEPLTSTEWSISLAERFDAGSHSVCGYYHSPSVHARATRGATEAGGASAFSDL